MKRGEGASRTGEDGMALEWQWWERREEEGGRVGVVKTQRGRRRRASGSRL